MNRLMCIVGVVIVSAGCSVIRHADKLLVLKSVADSQAALSKDVDKQDALFEKMIKQYESDRLVGYLKERQFTKAFGPPIFKRPFLHGSDHQEEWLYRYSTRFFGSPKIYVYFDEKGARTDLRFEAGEDKASAK